MGGLNSFGFSRNVNVALLPPSTRMSQTSVHRDGHRLPRPEPSSSDHDDGGTLEAAEAPDKEAEEGGEEDMEIDELQAEEKAAEHEGAGRALQGDTNVKFLLLLRRAASSLPVQVGLDRCICN